MRRLELHMKDGEAYDTAIRIIKQADPVDYIVIPLERRDRKCISVFLKNETGQSLMDNLQTALADEKDWRLSLERIEATAPEIKEETGAKRSKASTRALREEIYAEVSKGAALEVDFLVLVILSTIVAAVGLVADSVAGVIGAMVIAPLLGPILAFCLGAALGDTALLRRATATLLIGIGIAILGSIGLSQVLGVQMSSRELVSRAEVRLDGVALSMAAGGAAALSIARGQGTVLVGVMVAAALLPPAAAVGLFIGEMRWPYAMRSGLLLALNVASLILSALIVFRWKGIKPKGWLEQKGADMAVRVNMVLSAILLTAAVVLIVFLDLGQRITIG